MSVTSIVYSVQTSIATLVNPFYMGGYRAIFTVTDALNIDQNIFVRQREVSSADPTNFIDSFYTVASVADIADLQVGFSDMEHPFYRVNTVELVFPNLNELQDAVAKIKAMIACLQRANDAALNMAAAEVIGVPDNQTLLRYWGVSTDTAATDADLHTFTTDEVYAVGNSMTFYLTAPRYLYFAYRAELGAPSAVTINGTPNTPVLVTRSVVNLNGYTASYRIYRSSTTQNGDVTLVFSP